MDFPSSDFPIFPLCFTLIFLSMKVSSLEICCSMRYAIEALVELLDLGVSHQGVHRYIMDRTSSLQSIPVHSSPPGYQIKATWIWWIPGGYLVDTWWIPGGFGNCTRSCLDTSGVLTFSCPSCQSSSDSHFFPDNWSAPGIRRTWETPGEQCPLVTLSGLVTMTMKHHQNLSKSYPVGPRRFYCLSLPWRSKASALSSSAARSTSWHFFLPDLTIPCHAPNCLHPLSHPHVFLLWSEIVKTLSAIRIWIMWL